jgi:hypothetical protein
MKAGSRDVVEVPKSLLWDLMQRIEDGDVRGVHDALELLASPIVYRCECEFCGARFEWPGYLQHHLNTTTCGWKAAA